MKQITARIIDTSIKVSFQLSHDEYIYYHYVRGLITRKEAEAELSTYWDAFEELRMTKLAKHFS